MERTTQSGLLAQIGGLFNQHVDGSQTSGHDFAGFFQKHIQQLIVHLRLRSGNGRGHHDRWQVRRYRQRLLRCLQVKENIGCQLVRCSSRAGVRRRCRNGRCRRGHLLRREARHNIGQRRSDALLQFLRCFCHIICGTRAGFAHQNAQLTQFFIVDKELARHRALVAQHVDQEPERTQTVTQFLE